MGVTGRPAKPLALKMLNGRHEGVDSGGRKLEQFDAGFERGAPPCPDWLEGEARETWERLIPKLTAIGILKPEDRDAFAAYCLAVQAMRLAAEDIARNGMRVETERGGTKPNPAVEQLRKAQDQIRAFSHEFGLTPASESNVAVVGAVKKDDDDNPFA